MVYRDGVHRKDGWRRSTLGWRPRHAHARRRSQVARREPDSVQERLKRARFRAAPQLLLRASLELTDALAGDPQPVADFL